MDREDILAKYIDKCLLYGIGSLVVGQLIFYGLMKILPEFMMFHSLVFLIFVAIFILMMKLLNYFQNELQEIVNKE